MKSQQKITRDNYLKLIENKSSDLDFRNGLTRFYFTNKDGFKWTYLFYNVANGYYQVNARLGHQKSFCAFAGSLETIMEQIIES